MEKEMVHTVITGNLSNNIISGQKGLNMQLQTSDKYLLSQAEVIFIKRLAEEEFKSGSPCDSLKTKEKIRLLCQKFEVCSFEEVLRKVIFYNMISIELSENYTQHIENYSIEKIYTRNAVRTILLDLALNSSSIFCEFCYNIHFLSMPEMKEMVKEYISRINSDTETDKILSYARSFISLTHTLNDFEQIFNIVFNLDDDEYLADAETVVDIFNSYTFKYMFIIRVLVDMAFPVCKNREITIEEKRIIRHLLHKGDEIDYMQQFNIPPLVFNEKLKSIMAVYDSKTVQEMLIKATIDTSLWESNQLNAFFRLRIRTLITKKYWEKVLEYAPENEQSKLNDMFHKIEEYTENSLFSEDFLNELMEKIKDYCDSDFSIKGKLDPVIEWFGYDNLQIVSELHIILNQIDAIVPYSKVVPEF